MRKFYLVLLFFICSLFFGCATPDKVVVYDEVNLAKITKAQEEVKTAFEGFVAKAQEKAEAEQQNKAKAAANLVYANSAIKDNNDYLAQQEILLAQSRLNATPDPTELAAAEQRKQLFLKRGEQEASILYTEAHKIIGQFQQTIANLDIEQAKTVIDLKQKNENLNKETVSLKNEVDANRKKNTEAIAGEKKRIEEENVKQQAALINYFAIGVLGLVPIIAAGAFFIGGLPGLRKVIFICIILGISGVALFYISQILAVYWVKWVVLSLSVILGIYIFKKNHIEDNHKNEIAELNQKIQLLDTDKSNLEKMSSTMITVMDDVYENATKEQQAFLDDKYFSILSKEDDQDIKALKYQIRAKAKSIKK